MLKLVLGSISLIMCLILTQQWWVLWRKPHLPHEDDFEDGMGALMSFIGAFSFGALAVAILFFAG
jgi:hypothetical protein